jgi:hypothetical protein
VFGGGRDLFRRLRPADRDLCALHGPRRSQFIRVCTQFGKSTGYLVLSAATFTALYFLAPRWRRFAWGAGFALANVRVSAIATDIVKVIVGRARRNCCSATDFTDSPGWKRGRIAGLFSQAMLRR